MKRYTLALLAAIIATMGLLWSTVSPSQASVNWSPAYSHTDCQGNGCLTLYYRIDLSHSVGFYVEGYKISAAGGGVTYQGAGGKGGSIWNENFVVKWSIGGSASSLNPGQSKFWDLEIAMPDAARLVAGWSWEDIFVPGTDVNQCAKVTVKHSDWSTGGCG